MPNILFVCTANQFRSPLCAAFFEQMLKDKGVPGTWAVDSAGTWVPRVTGAHSSALKEAKKLGIDLSHHRTKEVNEALLATSDLVVVMTGNHKEALEVEFPSFCSKVHCLTEFSGSPGTDIEDPSMDGFQNAENATIKLLEEVKNSTNSICQYCKAVM